MKQHKEWVRLPTQWILKDYALEWFSGAKGSSADTAALMVLIAIAHNTVSDSDHPDLRPGETSVTYVELMLATGLSKASVSAGLNVLVSKGLIERRREGRNSVLTLARFNEEKSSWGKLPAKALYTGDQKRIRAFQNFTMRSDIELHALKLYLLIVALRENEINAAFVGNEKIRQYTRIPLAKMRDTRARLLSEQLITIEPNDRAGQETGVSFKYRLLGISPRLHAGTTGRQQFGGNDLRAELSRVDLLQ